MAKEIKIVVSSSFFAECLGKIDLEGDNVAQASISDNGGMFQLNLMTAKDDAIQIPVEVEYSDAFLQIKSGRWDWVKKLLNDVSDQPVAIRIWENGVHVTFQY